MLITLKNDFNIVFFNSPERYASEISRTGEKPLNVSKILIDD